MTTATHHSKLWHWLLRPLLFQLPPEVAHQLVLTLGAQWAQIFNRALPENDPTRAPQFNQQLMGLTFPNPIGLAAGLDKDAEALLLWQRLGFGFIEVGTVTAQAQDGNPRPRLWRLPREQALINRMGFNNAGAAALAKRLTNQHTAAPLQVPLGVNIGKTKAVALEHAAADYRASVTQLAHLADYLVVNLSSPNTPGLRNLQTAEDIALLLNELQAVNLQLPAPRPLLVKLAPDLPSAAAITCAQAALDHGAAGLILTNTTNDFSHLTSATLGMSGGLSGRPLWSRSTDLLANVRAAVGKSPVLIGVGGIFTPADVAAKLAAGANLVQIYTGLIYQGPGLVRHLLRQLDWSAGN
ncbi:quinone-dependent dihydroorotate dehydrogenase [Rhodoferax sp. 4810]|uniref:Dihydroorotate dehydrogenase (quinone) n=1 Tax=Thiospirillum jenense TaxID=1653858 RepID=A0A839HJG8_9GAMM|nr:quinone-dependent dihydroorotate dehydrogenase [Thiospirillum jenense]MBB1075090.1 quinone-dependent dihydroorotate dehydrogenase [Rhodoferax jenense]MBB1126739.1 quinone-dependent dihydroorotate dehydrogenase [Thiospirillum jenense]